MQWLFANPTLLSLTRHWMAKIPNLVNRGSRGTIQIFEVQAAPILGNGIVKALVTLKNNTRIKQADEIRSTFVVNVPTLNPSHHSSVLSRPCKGPQKMIRRRAKIFR